MGMCQYLCSQRGNQVQLETHEVETIFNVSIIVYQHLECPEDQYGPGCEQNCDCSERETCHYIE